MLKRCRNVGIIGKAMALHLQVYKSKVQFYPIRFEDLHFNRKEPLEKLDILFNVPWFYTTSIKISKVFGQTVVKIIMV